MNQLSAMARRFFDRGQFLDVAGMKIFVFDSGPSDRPAARLLLHGFPSSSLDFHHIVPMLSAEHRVVLIDLPGFGFSDKPQAYSYSLHEQADVVLLVLRRLGVQRVQVVAHDMGTSVACELVARRERGLLPVSLQSLTLMNGSVHIELAQLTPAQQILRSPLGPYFARLSRRVVFMLQLRRILGKRVPDEDLSDMWELLQHNNGQLRLPQSIYYIAERTRFWQRWIGALRHLDVPTLVLWGNRDPVAVPAIAQQLAEEIPGARLQWLDGIGHYPQLEAPANVAAALGSFLQASSD